MYVRETIGTLKPILIISEVKPSFPPLFFVSDFLDWFIGIANFETTEFMEAPLWGLSPELKHDFYL